MTAAGTLDDVRFEDLIPLNEVSKRLPERRGKRIHLSQPYRWAKRGLDGVVLRTVKVGGVMHTSDQWLWEFFNRGNAPAATKRQTPAKRRKQQDRTEAELESAGW